MDLFCHNQVFDSLLRNDNIKRLTMNIVCRTLFDLNKLAKKTIHFLQGQNVVLLVIAKSIDSKRLKRNEEAMSNNILE